MAVPPRIPVWLPLDRSVIYFVTINVQAKRNVLANPPAFAAWQYAIGKLLDWTVRSGVMMPNPTSRIRPTFKKSYARKLFICRGRAV